MKPYSKDLRTRVLAAVDHGEPRGEVVKIFSVSVPTIKRWLKRRRETGGVEVIPIPGRPRVKGAALERWLPENTCPTTTTLPSMMRLRARAPKGQRAYGKVPRNRGKNWTLIASITLEGAWAKR